MRCRHVSVVKQNNYANNICLLKQQNYATKANFVYLAKEQTIHMKLVITVQSDQSQRSRIAYIRALPSSNVGMCLQITGAYNRQQRCLWSCVPRLFPTHKLRRNMTSSTSSGRAGHQTGHVTAGIIQLLDIPTSGFSRTVPANRLDTSTSASAEQYRPISHISVGSTALLPLAQWAAGTSVHTPSNGLRLLTKPSPFYPSPLRRNVESPHSLDMDM